MSRKLPRWSRSRTGQLPLRAGGPSASKERGKWCSFPHPCPQSTYSACSDCFVVFETAASFHWTKRNISHSTGKSQLLLIQHFKQAYLSLCREAEIQPHSRQLEYITNQGLSLAFAEHLLGWKTASCCCSSATNNYSSFGTSALQGFWRFSGFRGKWSKCGSRKAWQCHGGIASARISCYRSPTTKWTLDHAWRWRFEHGTLFPATGLCVAFPGLQKIIFAPRYYGSRSSIPRGH